MNNGQEELSNIYLELGKLLKSILPEGGIEAYFYADIYKTSSGSRFYWMDENGDDAYFEWGQSPTKYYREIRNQLKTLQKHPLFEKEPWTHCKVTLTFEMKLEIKFAYVAEEDTWSGLYLKGVSELSLEEAMNEHGVPKEEWEKRQNIKAYIAEIQKKNALIEEIDKQRDDFYKSLGKLDEDVIAPMMSSALSGGAKWPIREAWSVIRKEDSIIIASNGLSDSFEEKEQPNNGYGIEVMAETKDTIEDIHTSWLFKLVKDVSNQSAHNRKFKELLKKYKIMTMEIPVPDEELEKFQNENGNIGIMLGINHPEIPTSFNTSGGVVDFITIKLLSPSELKLSIEKGNEGREELNEIFQKNKTYHFSKMMRTKQYL